MKILFIIKSLEKGGAERYALDLCLELNKRPDIEYKLLVLQDGNDFEYLSSEVPFEKLDGPYIPSIRGKSEVNVEQYKKIVDEFQPDIIHTHLFRPELFTSIYVPENVAYVVHCHDNMVEFKNLSWRSFLKKNLLTNFYEKRLLVKNKYEKNRNTYFIANSPDTLEYFQNTVPGFLKKNVVLIEYGFDFNRFFLADKQQRPPNKKFSIINIGRFERRKNQIFIVRIADLLRKRNFDFEVNLLGVGEHLDEVKQAIEELNLEDRVFVRGNVNLVEEYLFESDVYLHSAYYEPFGLVLLEGMAAGLPCIILDGIGNRNLVKDDYNGYLFYEQNPEVFADKIMELAADEKLLKQLSANAQAMARTYDIAEKTDELIEFYKKIIVK